MATDSFTVAPTNATDAEFRAWAQAVADAFTDMGWVDTNATGSLTISTASRPGAANTFVGFRVYRMDDALQATLPCFAKVEFGSNSVQNTVSIRLTVGTAHDGSGTLTGTQLTTALPFGGSGNSSTACQCYVSGTSARLSVAMFVENGTVSASLGWAFGIERSKDVDGDDTADAIVLQVAGFTNSTANYLTRTYAIPPSGGVPPAELRWLMPSSRNATGASEFDSIVAMGLVVPFMGAALRPVMNFGSMNTTDVPTYASTISVTVYGASHTYIALGTSSVLNETQDGRGSTSSGSLNNPVRLLMRYE